MTARTHDLIAFGSLLTAAIIFPPAKLNVATLVVCLVGNTVGALIPDMDQATNRLWDLLPGGNLWGNIFRKIMLSHRTISHSILGVVLLHKLLLLLLPIILNQNAIYINLVVASVLTGTISHLAADALTKEGIPLFFPFTIKIGFPPFKLLRITTGKFMEKFIIFPGVLIYIFWIASTKKEIIVAILKIIKN